MIDTRHAARDPVLSLEQVAADEARLFAKIGRGGDAESPPARPLSAQQEAFCRAFLARTCGAEAARDAGYAPRSARNAAYRLLRRPAIRARLRMLIDQEAGRHITDAARLRQFDDEKRDALRRGDACAAARGTAAKARFLRLLPARESFG